jgi:hypothetical protein
MKMEEKQILEYNFQDLLPIGLVVITLVLVLAYGADIVGNVGDDHVTGAAGCNATTRVNCNYAYNVTDSGTLSLNNMGDKIPTIVGVLVAAVIIGVVMSFMKQ